jgi:hypothetical protein
VVSNQVNVLCLNIVLMFKEYHLQSSTETLDNLSMGCSGSIWLTWDNFWKNTGIAGASNAGRSSSLFRRILWIIVFVAGLAVTVQAVVALICDYLQYPVDTTVTMTHLDRVRFTASFCITAICCICDLVSDKNHVLSFARAANHTPNRMCDTKSQLRHKIASTTPNRICDLVSMRFGVANLSQIELEIAHQIAQQIATRYRKTNHNTISHAMCKGSNSVCDTKSQLHQIASAICSKSDMKSHTKLLV